MAVAPLSEFLTGCFTCYHFLVKFALQPILGCYPAIPTESKLISFLTPGTFSSTTFSGGMGVGAGIIIGTDGIAILYGAVLAGVGADTPLLGTQLEKKAELNWDWIGRTDTSISRAHIRLDNDEEVECQCMKYFHDPVNIPPVSPPR